MGETPDGVGFNAVHANMVPDNESCWDAESICDDAFGDRCFRG